MTAARGALAFYAWNTDADAGPLAATPRSFDLRYASCVDGDEPGEVIGFAPHVDGSRRWSVGAGTIRRARAGRRSYALASSCPLACSVEPGKSGTVVTARAKALLAIGNGDLNGHVEPADAGSNRKTLAHPSQAARTPLFAMGAGYARYPVTASIRSMAP